MKIRPLGDRVILRAIPSEEKTKAGIIIPDSAKEKPMEGEVMAAGKGRMLEDGTIVPMEVKEGDRVLFSKWGGTEIKIDGEEYLMIKESELLGIIG
ncbi:MAG: co-chaperone GroES [Candidatus Eremiobacteraeota bacterium]|nr:co-chaperone GroES [Candidatus Eremiobacteraeota bacterium]